MNPLGKIEQVLLNQLKVAVHHQVDLEAIQGMRVDAVVDEVSRRMVVSLRAHVLAEKLPPELIERSAQVEFEVPASWWQHFKADHSLRWWLRWLVRRRPVVMETLSRTAHWNVSLERYRTYPRAQALPVKFGEPVQVHMLADERVRWSD